jgi:hypothetical protein
MLVAILAGQRFYTKIIILRIKNSSHKVALLILDMIAKLDINDLGTYGQILKYHPG